MNKRRVGVIFVVVLSVALLGSLATNAAELAVPEDYSHIWTAVEAANPGDTIVLAEGVYEGSVAITKDNITIKSAGDPENTTFKGTISLQNASGLVVDGLTITGAGNGIEVRGDCTGDDPTLTVKNSFISGNEENGIDFSGTYGGVTIEGNEINENGGTGVNLRGESGVGDIVSITNNEISNNGATQATGAGVKIGKSVEGVLVAGNTLEGNEFANIH
ncbi:right-handed parallel beta-helix repeat-containing protein [Candidatus Bipolaricaulota bacterium]|nr:right-handed parallel beta-helix repeat-containing protein [Candidatus Bipolaricaulota bacterium]